MYTLLLALACAPDTTEDTDLPVDTDIDETAAPESKVLIWAADPEAGAAAAWVTWFSARWPTEAHAWGERRVKVPNDALVVFLPDLLSSAAADADDHARGGATLGMGLGGAYAYEGLGNGLGFRNGTQGKADRLSIAEGHQSDLVFADVTAPEDGVVPITTQPISAMGIHPADSLEVVAWDDDFPDQYGYVAYSGNKAWYWGWGDADVGAPQTYTEDGLVLLGNIVQGLVPRR